MCPPYSEGAHAGAPLQSRIFCLRLGIGGFAEFDPE